MKKAKKHQKYTSIVEMWMCPWWVSRSAWLLTLWSSFKSPFKHSEQHSDNNENWGIQPTRKEKKSSKQSNYNTQRAIIIKKRTRKLPSSWLDADECSADKIAAICSFVFIAHSIQALCHFFFCWPFPRFRISFPLNVAQSSLWVNGASFNLIPFIMLFFTSSQKVTQTWL